MAVAIVSGPPLCFCHSTQKSIVALVGAMVGVSSRIRVGNITASPINNASPVSRMGRISEMPFMLSGSKLRTAD
jgi:hypothetical protein